MSLTFFSRVWAGGAGNDRFDGFDQANPGFTLVASVETDSPGTDSISGFSGDDEINGTGGINFLDGGAGNDTLRGAGQPDVLTGGFGALDELTGGVGNDLFVEVGESNLDSAFLIDGGAGFDTLRVSGNTRFVNTVIDSVEALEVSGASITLSAASFALFQLFRLPTNAAGTTVTFNGTGGLYDFSGKAFEVSNGGPVLPSAWFSGGAGDETVIGTERDDVLSGGAGDNSLSGADGNDRLSGAGLLSGGDGADTINDFGSAVTADRLIGGEGDDSLLSTLGFDTLDGGIGADRLRATGTSGGDRLSGGGGNDTLEAAGFSSPDTLLGGDGDDLLTEQGTVGAGAFIDGGAGQDTLDASGATLSGATLRGIDTLRANFAVTIGAAELRQFATLDLTNNAFLRTAGSGLYDLRTKTLVGDAGLLMQGTAFAADTILGGAIGETLEGLSGSDLLWGGAGNDILAPGEGNDSVEGGAGIDTGYFVLARSFYTITVLGAGRIEVSGAEGADTLRGVERLRFTDMTIELTTAGDDSLMGTAAPENLTGGSGNDTVAGRGGADALGGQAGDDLLQGEEGDDRLLGGAGADTLAGGSGTDILIGHSGADAFLFLTPGLGADRIVGFAGGEDRILLSATGFGLPAGALDPARLEVNATGQATASADATLIYRTTNGAVLFDADGTGAGSAVMIALLAGAPILASTDITVIA